MINQKLVSIISFLLVIGIIVSPIILSKFFYLNSQDASSVGDAIAGSIAPSASLLSAFLVFFALQEQVKANNLIIKQFNANQKDSKQKHESDLVLKHFNYFQNRIQNYYYQVDSGGVPYSGAQAIIALGNSYSSAAPDIAHKYDLFTAPTKLSIFYHLIESYSYLISLVISSSLLEGEKQYFIKILDDIDKSIFKQAFQRDNKKRPICSKCLERHSSMPIFIYALYIDCTLVIENNLKK